MVSAKKSARKSDRKKAPTKEQEVESLSAKVVIHPSEDTPFFYINYAEIVVSEHDFNLYGVRVPAKLVPSEINILKESGEINVEPIVHLIIPATIIDGLINALTRQKEVYKQQQSKIPSEGEK